MKSKYDGLSYLCILLLSQKVVVRTWDELIVSVSLNQNNQNNGIDESKSDSDQILKQIFTYYIHYDLELIH